MTLLEKRFGGRRPFLRHIVTRVSLLFGGWRRERAVNWHSVQRVVFVCAGNICRSPYGEARAKALGLAAASSGISAIRGALANQRASEIARERGLDLSAHRSAPYGELQLLPGDLIVLFEPSHLRSLIAQLPGVGVQTTLAGLWVSSPRPYIADPFGRSPEYFRHCFDLIDAAVAGIHARLAKGP